MIALDASALLAFLFREEGHERVRAHIERCCLSAVNLSEVIGRFVRDGHPGEQVRSRIAATSIEIVPFFESDAARAASLLPATQPLGLSLGDRACLALALARKIPALTADRSWKSLAIGVSVQVIRGQGP
ncbi:MAG: type II toxin-antitoxin system VapC family toxin [Deltaproteobacteria bacterium]|nr:type II toxin-antitoxin system VapC family toxin [Deltaproteobacteria bacterium]